MKVGENVKKCQYCNKTFEPHNNKQKYCDSPHIRICPVCNKEYVEKNNWQLQFPPHACSYKCRGILQSQTKAMKPKKKRKLQQLLIDNPEFLAKFEDTNILNRRQIISKLQSLLETEDILYTHPIHIGEYVYEFWIKDQNLLICLAEFSEDVNFNLKKVKIAEEQSYQCLVIYPWDDLQKIVWQLKPKKLIDLNKCSMYRLNKQPAVEFLQKYHLQSSCRNQLLFWGIVKDDEILQIMTFGKPRYNQNYSVELMRACTKPSVEIDGEYTNLFYGVNALQSLTDIIGYSQIGRIDSVNFESLPFDHIKTTPPQEIWLKENKHITASLLRDRGYDQLFGTHYGRGVSNEMLMLQNGWLPVYDCGQKVFVYE